MFLSESEISKMGDMLNNKGSMANVWEEMQKPACFLLL
jgi:hypothetical protein